jgi:uncharacterized protein with GYD domain
VARSEQTFLPRGQYDLVTKIEARALPAARTAALTAARAHAMRGTCLSRNGSRG